MAPMHDELEEISLEKSMSYVGSNSRVRKEYEALKAENKRLEAQIAVKDTQLLSVVGKSGKEVQLESENKRLEAREAVHVKALELIADKHGDWTEAFMRQKARTALKQAGEIK
jgi:hypothetical protein